MYSLLTRLWEWCRLGRLKQSVVAGLTAFSRATLLAASPGRELRSGTTGSLLPPGRRGTPSQSRGAAHGIPAEHARPVPAHAPGRPFHARGAREAGRTCAATRARVTSRPRPRRPRSRRCCPQHPSGLRLHVPDAARVGRSALFVTAGLIHTPPPGPPGPPGRRLRVTRRSRWFPRTAGDAAVVLVPGVTGSDADAQAGISEVPENAPHPLAPSTRPARHASPRLPWQHLMHLMHLTQLMDALGATPFDPRGRGADRIR